MDSDDWIPLNNKGYVLVPKHSMHASTYKTRTPAKLNIRLKVVGRRRNGYHDLVSIMVPVTLFDDLEFEMIPEGITLACNGVKLPVDRENLAYRAAELFFKESGIREGVAIRLDKRIPVAAGLGGGSSDAAATLLALNEMWARPLKEGRLYEMALALGADVPFFVGCRPSLATGIGEVLAPIKRWPRLWYVIITPPLQISTAWVYGNLKLKLTAHEYGYIVKILNKGNIQVPQLLENDLETVTSTHYPIIDTIKEKMMDAGAEGALMSGSGPSVFGIFNSVEKALFTKEHLISQNLGDVFVVTDWRRH